ncbi:putative iron complex outermembrane receptor protein [Candidatus Termititenax aidoneus]|uniref:Iron complex outermembrane receptor protein n=1 Tax=Termititenax aidoneus TaxID=2218524 RepID=A0A388TAH2_TERA1|nr:putative iron complex outermembrane receptor protein [Candidatus Termititenax aidoneus]
MKKFLVLCCFVCGYAFSQIYETEGITVVGKRLYDGSLQTGYYGAAQIITSADITAVGALTVPDVLQKYGVAKYSNATGSPLDWTLNWNGFSKGEEIVVIVDGVKVNEADDNVVYWTNIPVADIERIEILPGAGSAQYGSGAFAGVLNIVTNKSAQKSVVAEIGTDGYGRQGFTLGDTFAENFYYRLNFDNLAATGQRKHSAYRDQRLSGKLGWFNDSSELNLYYKLADAQANYPDQLTAKEILDNRRQAIAPDSRDIDTDQTNLEYLGRLGADWTYVLNLGLKNRTVKYDTVGRGGDETIIRANENSHSYLGQLTYKNKLTFGYDYRLANIRSKDYGTDSYDAFYVPIIVDINEKTADISATKGEYAPYIQYFDRWGAVYWRYGAREDSVDYVQTDNFNKSAERKTKKFSKRAHNGEVGVNFLNDWQTYFSYGEAFKAPGFSYLFGSWGANENLSAELAKTQTAGLRWQNTYTNFNWNVFNTLVDDEIIWVCTDPGMGDGINQNAQKTRRDGFNLNIEQKLNAEWQIFTNYNYTKARFIDATVTDWNTYPYETLDLSGYALPLVPEQVYSFGLNYVVSNWSLSVIQNFVDKQYADGDYTNEYDFLSAYSFADARIAYSPFVELNLYLNIHNVLNNIYNTKTLAGEPIYYTPADLRTAAIGAQWSF